MVVLDDAGAVVRPALLWNDTRSAPRRRRPGRRARRPGRRGPTAVGLGAGGQLHRDQAALAGRARARAAPRGSPRVLLPHDWLTWRLRRARRRRATTDRGDASGTGYWSPADGDYRADLLRLALRPRASRVPRVAAPAEPVGRDGRRGAVLGPGHRRQHGRRARARRSSRATWSSRSARAAPPSRSPRRRPRTPTGIVAGFADATGRFLPLVCTLNAARVLGAGRRDARRRPGPASTELALSAAPGAGGLVLLPYLDGERTPNLPDATGTLRGLTRAQRARRPTWPGRASRACCAGWPTRVDALRRPGRAPSRRVLLIGGAARVGGGARDRAGAVRRCPVRVPAAGRVRRARRGPAGGLDAAGRRGAAAVGAVVRRGARGRPAAAGARRVRRPSHQHAPRPARRALLREGSGHAVTGTHLLTIVASGAPT